MAGQLLDDVFIVMANRQQAHIFVVEHFVFVMEFIDETLKNRFIIVDAKRERDCRILNQVKAESVFG